MKRALILILLLTALTFGGGTWLDHLQKRTAASYLQGMETIRRAVLNGSMDQAAGEQAYWHALWQHDSNWLNAIISHQHTRDVNAGMTRVATALEMGWRDEAIRALDDTSDALAEIAVSNLPLWENIL